MRERIIVINIDIFILGFLAGWLARTLIWGGG